jgi:hypothetical protein
MQQAQDVKPAFEVEHLEGQETVTRNFYKDGVFTQEDEEIDKGYMVYFPNGHSIRVRTDKEMRRLGFLENPELLDMESGETVQQGNMTLKENSRRKTKTRNKTSATSGVMKDG